MSNRYDALVIGGGVAGSTAAILLAAAGWSVALVEKRAFPRRKVCGECIAAPNVALLDALGVGRRVSRAGRPAARAESGSSPATTSCTLDCRARAA